MSKQFWAFLGVGLVVVAIAVSAIWSGTKSAHLELTGKILKVRSIPLEGGSSLVVVDFRVTNPSGIPFETQNVSLSMERYKEETLEGTEVAKPDAGHHVSGAAVDQDEIQRCIGSAGCHSARKDDRPHGGGPASRLPKPPSRFAKR